MTTKILLRHNGKLQLLPYVLSDDKAQAMVVSVSEVNGLIVIDDWGGEAGQWYRVDASGALSPIDTYGVVVSAGIKYVLIEEPAPTCRMFPGCYPDAQDGDPYTEEYQASAVGPDGKYTITWQWEAMKGYADRQGYYHGQSDASDPDNLTADNIIGIDIAY